MSAPQGQAQTTFRLGPFKIAVSVGFGGDDVVRKPTTRGTKPANGGKER